MHQRAGNHLDLAAINESWLAKTARTRCRLWHFLYLVMNMSSLEKNSV
jgi:hypothetical protein